jgi:hypothetical protein
MLEDLVGGLTSLEGSLKGTAALSPLMNTILEQLPALGSRLLECIYKPSGRLGLLKDTVGMHSHELLSSPPPSDIKSTEVNYSASANHFNRAS